MGSDGLGQHAEDHCCERANRERLRGKSAILYVAARRRRNGKVVTAKPCIDCWRILVSHTLLTDYRDGDGQWLTLDR